MARGRLPRRDDCTAQELHGASQNGDVLGNTHGRGSGRGSGEIKFFVDSTDIELTLVIPSKEEEPVIPIQEKLPQQKTITGKETLKFEEYFFEYESNLETGKISLSSPIAKGLIGKAVGDSAEITTPSGKKYYEILEIKVIDTAIL